jgi:tetratricopeptide (TPR) repeat protein
MHDMEELFELKAYIEQGRYAEALQLVEEMEEMAKDDKINKIYSFTVIMLIHLIKKHAEKRTTRSWEYSIWNASRQIRRVNKRRKSGGFYLSEQEVYEVIAEAYPDALKRAALEAFEGQYAEAQLETMIDREQMQQEAFEIIMSDQE